MKDFSGHTPYSVMFGPDICGYDTQKVHAILTDKKGRNLDLKPFVKALSDQLTHVYTYILRPNNTYQVCTRAFNLTSNRLDACSSVIQAPDLLEERQQIRRIQAL